MKNKDNIQQKTLVPFSPKEMEQSAYRGFQLPMIKDFHFDECASALQKCIRRSLEFEAVYWAGVFYRSGYSRYLAKRLKVIMEEDIGQGNPLCLVLANQLYHETQAKDYKAEQNNDGFLKYVNLIILACRSKKTRVADELGNIVLDLIDKLDLRLDLDIDYLDPHTAIGKIQHGRWDDNENKEKATERLNNWFNNWSYINNEDAKFGQYRMLNKAIWGLPQLSKKDKDVLIDKSIDLIERERKNIHRLIQINGSK